LSDPEYIEETSFFEELNQLAIQDNEWRLTNDAMNQSYYIVENLQELANYISSVCNLNKQDNYYSKEVLRREKEMQHWKEQPFAAVRFYSHIQSFCSVLGIVWFVVG